MQIIEDDKTKKVKEQFRENILVRALGNFLSDERFLKERAEELENGGYSVTIYETFKGGRSHQKKAWGIEKDKCPFRIVLELVCEEEKFSEKRTESFFLVITTKADKKTNEEVKKFVSENLEDNYSELLREENEELKQKMNELRERVQELEEKYESEEEEE